MIIDAEGNMVDGGSASPGSVATDDISPTPPSPCLHELGDDDATPRQQWSPVHQRLARAGSQPHGGHGATFAGARSGGCSSGGGSGSGGGSCVSGGGVSNNHAHQGRGGRAGETHAAGAGTFVAGSAVGARSDNFNHPQQRFRTRPDSPVMRVDLERLDLSVLALGEERSSSVAGVRGHGGGSGGGVSGPSSRDRNPDTFSSEPGGHIGIGARPKSLGGRPLRTHELFVAPGHLGTGPSSPPSSYSTHSESGFASPTRRVASPGVFSREQGRVRKGHWKKGKPIGVGSCGNVYLGMNEDTGELMAVKEITLEAKERLLCSLYNEIQVMHKLVHPHIVGYLGAELQDSQRKLCIFQEWVPAGSLHSLLDQFGALSDAMTRKYTMQVLEGLAYLHANRVIHRDVKSKNILVDDRGNVKLADFGCALVLKDDNHRGDGVEMSMKGTPLFMAPEMLLKRKCGRRVDVWSLGCAVLEMVTTRPPWADAFKHPVEIITHFTENPGPPPLPSDLAPGLRNFLLSCFTWDAEVRPSAQELISHAYIQPRAPLSSSDGSPGDDMPLEEMDRVSAVTRMRRCSSATLDILAVQARQAALGVSITGALAAFGTAPSGTFRPPSPRYGPGGIVGHGKRTPTRRRMYTEQGLPPPESIAPSIAKVAATAAAAAAAASTHAPAVTIGGVHAGSAPGTEIVRRFSMPHARFSPPISPDKPRRPGRGTSTACAVEEEGRSSGPILPFHLRNLGHGIGRGSGSRGTGGESTSGNASSEEGVHRGPGSESNGTNNRSCESSNGSTRSINSDSSGGHTTDSASVSSMSSGAGQAHKTEGLVPIRVVTRKAPTPIMPPVVQDLLGVAIAAENGGTEFGPVGDTPPPTVRPLGIRRSTSARAGESTWHTPRDPAAAASEVSSQRKRDGTGESGMWDASGTGVMSDVRGSVGSRH